MNLAKKLVDEVLERPHLQVCRSGSELVDEWVPDHPEFRLIIGSGPRAVDMNPKWRTVHAYFAKWSEPGPDGSSVLERALKKIRWRGPHQTGTQRHDQLLDR